MGGLTRAIRVVFGAAMVAAGAALLHPLGSLLAAGYARSQVVPAAGGQPAAPAPPAPQPPPQAPVSWLVPESELPPPVTPAPGYVPPPPPDRLPPAPAAAVAAMPEMNGTYRSTLAVPPPPLLDAQHVDALPVEPQTPRQPAAATAAIAPAFAAGGVLPATHLVADGDDLTGIATRVYGNPGAAAAVWAANRDILTDPNLLPIGAELRLPPPWAVGGPILGRQDGRAIEPLAAPAVAPRAAAEPRGATAGGTQAWLTAAPAPGPEMRASGPAPLPARPVGGTIRLAPGETLATLAEKLYGDRNAASRIWEANRDRLRSPDLAVAGMELRLP